MYKTVREEDILTKNEFGFGERDKERKKEVICNRWTWNIHVNLYLQNIHLASIYLIDIWNRNGNMFCSILSTVYLVNNNKKSVKVVQKLFCATVHSKIYILCQKATIKTLEYCSFGNSLL